MYWYMEGRCGDHRLNISTLPLYVLCVGDCILSVVSYLYCTFPFALQSFISIPLQWCWIVKLNKKHFANPFMVWRESFWQVWRGGSDGTRVNCTSTQKIKKKTKGLDRRGQSNVWRLPKYWPPPPHPLASVYHPPLVRGEDTLAGGRGGGGSIVRKTPDTALYSLYVSTLWTWRLIH